MMAVFLAKTPQQLGAILRGFRGQRGLTQKDLAARLGLPQKAISLAETRPERLSVERLFHLLGALDIEVSLQDKKAPLATEAEW
jgi:HTH-type transcriptional regulator / antitoxin HipB